jgi:regulator of sigma E protease
VSKTKNLMSDLLRVVLVVAVAAAIVYLVARNIIVSKNILVVLLGFGAMILIHEFGHFIVAKVSGIKVEAFSIFMPPILMGIRRTHRGWRVRILPELFRREDDPEGDGLLSFTIGRQAEPGTTEYRIGLIPFGGFVKMLGQEDVGSVKSSNDPRSYANKPAHTRAAVLAAGVTFNAASAIIAFIAVFLVGINLPAPIVGGVIPGSPAERAGIKPGDEVIAINGKGGNLDFSDVMTAAALSGKGEQVRLTVQHEDGTIGEFSLAAEEIAGEQLRLFGIDKPLDLTIAQVSDVNELQKRTGLLPGDRIKAVGGRDVQAYWQVEEQISQTIAPSVTVLAQRAGGDGTTGLVESKLGLRLDPRMSYAAESQADLAHICSLVPRLRIDAVFDRPASFKNKLFSLLRKTGTNKNDVKSEPRIQAGDIILAIGDVNNPSYDEMREATKANENKELPIEVLRADANGPEKRLVVTVVPKRLPGSPRVTIGIIPVLDMEHAVVARAIATKYAPEPAAIPRGATIVAVDGQPVSNFYDVVRLLRQNEGGRVAIDWRVDEQLAGDIGLDVGRFEDSVTVRSSLADILPVQDLNRLYKASGPIEAISMGYRRTVSFILQTYVTLQRVIGGLVSPKELMGPVGILTLTYQVVASKPFVYYVYLLALISASIAVINFLPIPPFDGGLVVLLLVEKIKGSALSERTQEIIAYAGWVLVGVLLIYVTRNDIVRFFFG